MADSCNYAPAVVCRILVLQAWAHIGHHVCRVSLSYPFVWKVPIKLLSENFGHSQTQRLTLGLRDDSWAEEEMKAAFQALEAAKPEERPFADWKL